MKVDRKERRSMVKALGVSDEFSKRGLRECSIIGAGKDVASGAGEPPSDWGRRGARRPGIWSLFKSL